MFEYIWTSSVNPNDNVTITLTVNQGDIIFVNWPREFKTGTISSDNWYTSYLMLKQGINIRSINLNNSKWLKSKNNSNKKGQWITC